MKMAEIHFFRVAAGYRMTYHKHKEDITSPLRWRQQRPLKQFVPYHITTQKSTTWRY